MKTDEEMRETPILRYPVSVIRQIESGDLIGHFSIRRNEWEWMEKINPEGRKKLKKKNAAKVDDESISYSIGRYYLFLP
jgi:hypothetical protein